MQLDDRRVPIAETGRRVGAVAETLGLVRPSYEQIRRLVHAHRRGHLHSTSTGRMLLEISMRARAPEELLDHLARTGVRPLG